MGSYDNEAVLATVLQLRTFEVTPFVYQALTQQLYCGRVKASLQHVQAAAHIISDWPEDILRISDSFVYSLLEWHFDCEQHYCLFQASSPILPHEYRSAVRRYRKIRALPFE